ncbi:SET domain-containing protein [Pyrenochaeta sp. DS3sAY3a]|nr:SET domain-containing protein [Pyrenochaeta sp. DS3sAY3a]
MAEFNNLHYFFANKPVRKSGEKYESVHARCMHKNQTIFPRFTSENRVSKAKWLPKAKYAAPTNWPRHFKWPEEVDKAVYLTWPAHSTVANTDLANRCLQPNVPACHGAKCRKPKVRARNALVSMLCKCTKAEWESRTKEKWYKDNIELRHVDGVGIATFARNAFTQGQVIGEYVGELVPSDAKDDRVNQSAYLFDIKQFRTEELVLFVDAMRVGGWTRFANHSCNSNAIFEYRRVGPRQRVAVVVQRNIAVGQEVTVDYGDSYWDRMKDRKIYCRCGHARCRYSDPRRRGKKGGSRARGKGRATATARRVAGTVTAAAKATSRTTTVAANATTRTTTAAKKTARETTTVAGRMSTRSTTAAAKAASRTTTAAGRVSTRSTTAAGRMATRSTTAAANAAAQTAPAAAETARRTTRASEKTKAVGTRKSARR